MRGAFVWADSGRDVGPVRGDAAFHGRGQPLSDIFLDKGAGLAQENALALNQGISFFSSEQLEHEVCSKLNQA
jgi:hypothetical protein